MLGRALVIGASHQTSPGEPPVSELDALRMEELLEARGFEVERRVGQEATREGILGGYTRLIRDVTADDAAVIYFSGHGGAVPVPGGGGDPGAPPVPRLFQFIAPTDYAQTTEADFRGISSIELSLLLAELTGKTRNVTVILDCCYAGQMSRGDDKADKPPAIELTPSAIRRHLADLAVRYGPLDRLPPTGNPDAVRLVACGDWQKAQITRDERGPTGLLTSVLLETIREVGDRASWRTIGAVIRERVQRKASTQTPMVEGPVRRRLFSLQEVDGISIPIAGGTDGFRLEVGRIGGVTVGDVYGVVAPGSGRFDPASGIAHVRVEHTTALRALARPLRWLNGHTTLPTGAVAWPLELAFPRQPVRIGVPEHERPGCEEAITASARLRIATGDERAVGELHLHGRELGVLTGDGVPLRSESGSWSLASAVRQLEDIAAAQTLCELQGEGMEDRELEVEWGTVHGGVPIARPDGAALSEGDRIIYVLLRNRTEAVRFAHVFDINVRGRIKRLSRVAAKGIRLGPRGTAYVGPRSEELPKLRVTWPTGVPRDAPVIDRLVIILTLDEVDLGGLETHHAHARGGTALQRLLAQLHEGGVRRGELAPDPFLVVHRSWVLYPLRAPVARGEFLFDDDPASGGGVGVGAVSRCGGIARPIGIRLCEVAASRAVRIDSLVCTRSTERGRAYEARTVRIAAGAAHEHELWRGPARDVVEIYLWVSPAGGDAPELAALLEGAGERPEVAEAIDALVVRDERAPWALASGACGALANVAAARLRTALPEAAGLIHASATPADADGGGRRSRYRGRGVELTLEIAAP